MHFNNNKHPLAKILGLSGYELMSTISFLSGQNLVERVNTASNKDFSYNSKIILTSKGFDTALQNENNKINSNFQEVLVYTAVIGSLLGIYKFMYEPFSTSLTGFIKIFVGLVIILVGLILAVVISSFMNKCVIPIIKKK
jgi:hypothetical protein